MAITVTPVMRRPTTHALTRINERIGPTTAKRVQRWINRDVPPGEGHVIYGVFTFVFSPVRNGKQKLITVWKNR